MYETFAVGFGLGLVIMSIGGFVMIAVYDKIKGGRG